jgi:hypothetical protein
LGPAALASTGVYLHALDEDKTPRGRGRRSGETISVSRRALQAVDSCVDGEETLGRRGWLEWLRARLARDWRRGECDGEILLFSGDLPSPRTAAWPCRTPGCATGTRRSSGRCEGCRRSRISAGLSWAQFDADRRRG